MKERGRTPRGGRKAPYLQPLQKYATEKYVQLLKEELSKEQLEAISL